MILFSEYYESLSLMMIVLINLMLIALWFLKLSLIFVGLVKEYSSPWPRSTGRYVNLQNTETSFDHVYCSDKIYCMRAIITRGLYIFHLIFQCN